jgi:lipopolysaccharide/colanic/teichoic acid biosynthesis glycosyltransferase
MSAVFRYLEAILTLVALLLLFPVFAVIGLVILACMGPPILFRQTRIGLRERPFLLYKFRTMTDARDCRANLLPDEQRLLWLGRLLRQLSLDELPQLWNVLKGDMSLVGPRPLLLEYLPRYTPSQRRRHEVRPGITGWVQVNGRNSLTWEQKFELDVWYVDHRSVWLDVTILWMTMLQVLRRNGISQAGHATMPEFMGSSGQPGRNG